MIENINIDTHDTYATADMAIARSRTLNKTVPCVDSAENRIALALRSGEVIINDNTIDYFGVRWCVSIKTVEDWKPPV